MPEDAAESEKKHMNAAVLLNKDMWNALFSAFEKDGVEGAKKTKKTIKDNIDLMFEVMRQAYESSV